MDASAHADMKAQEEDVEAGGGGGAERTETALRRAADM